MKNPVIDMIKKSAVILLLSTLAGFVLLFLVYMIPDDAVKNTVHDLENVMDDECPGWIDTRFFSYAYGSKNMPDTFIRDLSFRKDASVINAAMGGIGTDEGNKRYWDGFMVIMRPLMTVFSYGQIRYFLVFIECILLWYVLTKAKDRIGWAFSFSVAAGLFLINLIVNFFGIMINMNFLIMFAFMAYILRNYDTGWDRVKLYYVFLINGILTTYLDRFTASLITLEMPLLIIVVINIRKNGMSSLKDNVYNIAASVLGWGAGWSVFWINKWILASAVLKEDIIGSALSQALMRSTTNADSSPVPIAGYKGGRIFTIFKNICALIPTHGENTVAVAVVMIMILIVMTVYLFWVHGYLKEWKKYLPVFFLILMPYVYYFILSNLCQIHATFYMYRMQLISVTGILYIYFEALRNGERDHG